MRLRHLLGFLPICRNYAKKGHARRGVAKYATPGSVADCVGSSGNREIARRISETPPSAPARGVCAIYSDFAGRGGILAKTGPRWRGGAKYANRRIRGRGRRIFRKSRHFSANLRKFPSAHARWVCSVYSDFSGYVGIRRKRGLLGAAGRNTRLPGSVADCIGPSGNREMSRRISETATGQPNGRFAPCTLISRDLSEFGENGA